MDIRLGTSRFLFTVYTDGRIVMGNDLTVDEQIKAAALLPLSDVLALRPWVPSANYCRRPA